MRKPFFFGHPKGNILFGFLFIFLCTSLKAQQPSISDFVIFSGKPAPGQTAPASPGYGVQVGSSSSIQGGTTGSYSLVLSTGSTSFIGNIYSAGKVQLANSNSVTGKITVANINGTAGTVLSVGSNASLGGDVFVNGNTVIGNGTISGTVTHAPNTTYSGPAPAGGNITAPLNLPAPPALPVITVFPASGTTNITATKTISPGAYGDVALNGNKTLTLSGTGVYVFKSIKNSGTTNEFVFDFKNEATGTIKIYIEGDVELNKVQASIINGGSASRIYAETHGTGSTSAGGTIAWNMANGSSGQNSKWLGSVWAPYASINIGSGTGSSNITGTLWSGTQVNIQSGVAIIYAPFSFCDGPDANAGPDKPLDFVNLTNLTGSSSVSGVSYSWQAINGGVITSPVNAATISVSAAGSYILTVLSGGNCTASDTAIVTGKTSNLIGSELQSVFQNFNPADAPSPFFAFRHDSIMIDVITREGKYNDALTLLTSPSYGLTGVLSNGASNFIITGLFPVAKLPLLNALGSLIVYCRPYYGAIHNSGIVSSAGDTAVRAQLVRSGYNLNGNGIKIGVISDSYNTITAATTNPVTNTAALDISNGDLPGPANPNGILNGVHVIKEYPFKSSDEGRGMLQIVHDVAPGAELYFRTGFISPGDFAAGIKELSQAGCKVIVDDITFITEPFLKDGVVAAAADEATASGTSYFSAAGNFAGKSYENTFNAVAAPGGLAGTAHNFGGGDVFQNVTLAPGNYTIVLQWLDDIYSLGQTAAGGTKNDLDIYLTPNTDGSALFGFNRNNTGGDPIEILPFTITSTLTTNILIANNTLGSNPARFKFIIFRGDPIFNEYATGTSTITAQANALGTITVGAARYDKVPPFTPVPVIESFSSIGGTVIGNVKRNKPDLVAPDGVNTTVGLGIDYDHDGYSNFFGTSAAAPHAAAVAALIMEGKKKFLNQPLTSPAEIKSLLQNTATDMNTPGFDNVSGYGLINADAAMRTFAKPDPTLIKLVVPANTTPGPATFTLTVTGLNLSPNSVIKFRDSTLGTTIINSTTATAVVPAFTGDPIISVYTPPASISGLDGGTSDTLRFFNLPRKKITVIADTKTKKYAQSLPALTATVLVDGDTLKNTLFTIAALGLDSLKLSVQATPASPVGTYVIIATRKFVAGNQADIGLQELYEYSFVQGSMTIEKLPVTITAQNVTVSYRQRIPDVQFKYKFDGKNIPDSIAFLNSLSTSHKAQLAKDGQGRDVLGVVNGHAITIVNGQAVTIVNGQAVTIVNGQAVTIVNGQAIPIVNGQAITIVNGHAVPIVNNLTADQVQNLSFLATAPSLQHARQITNQVLVNGVYKPDSTKVVDINQEAILDFNTNSAQTYMLRSQFGITANGLADQESVASGRAVTIVNGETSVEIINGQAVTIVNGQAVTIVNGQAIPIVNGQAVTIVNGQAVTIVNGQAIPIVNSQNKTAVVIDSSEIGQGQSSLKSLNMITGLETGNQFMIPGTLISDNLQLNYVAGIITIIPAPVVITPAAAQTKVFGTADPVLVYTNNAGLTAGNFTGVLGRASGEDAGTYSYTTGSLSAGTGYTLSIAATVPVPVFTILPKTINISPLSGQTKIYGNPDPVFTFSGADAITTLTGKLGRISGENTGLYAYTKGSLSAGINYNLVLTGSASFSITPAPLRVKANDLFIFQGDRQPAFTATITGLKFADNPAVTFTLSPVYTGAAGEYIITPLLSAFSNQLNYQVSYVIGTLYVNPEGPGTKKLRPSLDCIVEIINPAPGQFRYIAHFMCINDNSSTVYVPVGPDNLLSSAGGLFDGSAQPVVFKPGITRFDVPFDGIKLTWVVKTYETNHKTSVASDASSASAKCSISSARVMNIAEATTTVEELPGALTAQVYPNPATEKLLIYVSGGLPALNDIRLFSASGVLFTVKNVKRIAPDRIEVNVAGLPRGFYFIRCRTTGGYKTFRFVKG